MSICSFKIFSRWYPRPCGIRKWWEKRGG